MNTSPFRASYGVMLVLAMLSLAAPSSAQQAAAPAQQSPASSQPAASVAQPPAAPVVAASPLASGTSDAAATTAADTASKPLKTATGGLRELSPWSMFLSADILVKAVMIGLAFASLVTWTIFIAKIIELSLIQRGLRAALGKMILAM